MAASLGEPDLGPVWTVVWKRWWLGLGCEATLTKAVLLTFGCIFQTQVEVDRWCWCNGLTFSPAHRSPSNTVLQALRNL